MLLHVNGDFEKCVFEPVVQRRRYVHWKWTIDLLISDQAYENLLITVMNEKRSITTQE